MQFGVLNKEAAHKRKMDIELTQQLYLLLVIIFTLVIVALSYYWYFPSRPPSIKKQQYQQQQQQQQQRQRQPIRDEALHQQPSEKEERGNKEEQTIQEREIITKSIVKSKEVIIGETGIESLPEELYFTIFQYLEASELEVLNFVSKKWKRLVEDSFLWWNLYPFWSIVSLP